MSKPEPEILCDGVTLYEGDCLDVLRSLPDASVDAVVTDPPYGIAYQSAWRIDKRSRFDQIANDDAPFVWWLYDAVRVLKDGGVVLCFCRWDVQEAFRQAMQWAGLEIQSQIIWDRVVHGMGDLKREPAPRHDVIWMGVKGDYQLPGKRPTTIIQAQRLGGEELDHPNQKPQKLMRDLLRSYTTDGSTVLDCFGGSGATGEAAIGTGRRCILIEKDPAYCETIRKRVREADGGMFAAPAPVVGSLFEGCA